MYLLIDIFACFPIDIKNTSRASIKHGELLPPDHIPGAHVEQDGHINKDYHHEVFLGEYIFDFLVVSITFGNLDQLQDRLRMMAGLTRYDSSTLWRCE